MKPKIDRDELEDIVEETARLEEEESSRIEPEEARQVLREVGLPAEKLEEAQARVAVRREKEVRAKTQRRTIAAVVAAGALLTAGAVYALHARHVALESMAAQSAELHSGNATAEQALRRDSRPELVLDVVLRNPPEGRSIELTCDWKGPSGDLRYQNHWRTKEIDRAIWQTRCKRAFGLADPAGRWTVVMKEGDRSLTEKQFTLE